MDTKEICIILMRMSVDTMEVEQPRLLTEKREESKSRKTLSEEEEIQIPQNPSSEPVVKLSRKKKKKKKFIITRKNLKWGSTFFLRFGCSKPSIYYNTADQSEKKEEPPTSSLCLRENTSRKRRDVPHRKNKGGFKKAKVDDDPLPREPRRPPAWIFTRVGSHPVNPRLVFERTLTWSDVDSSKSRLLMPFKQLLCKEFLTPEEEQEVSEEKGLKTIIMVNGSSKEWSLCLKKWPMGRNMYYALNGGWNNVVRDNNLEEEDKISLWTFTFDGHRYIALDIVRKRRS